MSDFTCPDCNKPFTDVDNTDEEMLNKKGEQTCLTCFHNRFLTRFKENIKQEDSCMMLGIGQKHKLS